MGWCKLKCIIMQHSLSYSSQAKLECWGFASFKSTAKADCRLLMNVYEVAQSKCQINNSVCHCDTGVYSVETSRCKQHWE